MNQFTNPAKKRKEQLAEAAYAVAGGALMFICGMLIASGWMS